MTWRQGIAATALVTGCYASQGAGPPDRAACTFTLVRAGTVSCRIELTTATPCQDAARCFCLAERPAATEAELRECIGWMTEPRGAITFADFCSRTVPTRYTLIEAIEGVYPYMAQEPSPECSAIAAIAGAPPPVP